MLRRTFQHVPGIGEKTEQALWRAGVRDWDDFAPALVRPLCKESIRLAAEGVLEESRAALARADAAWFAGRLPRHEAWRLFPDFERGAGYLDIETTGVSGDDAVTVVGLSDGTRFESFVAGKNLDEFPDAIRRFRVLVTFNGIRFDVPFLQRAFPRAEIPEAQLDLRCVFAKLKLTGGLKKIEQALGIERPEDVVGINGWQAVVLWQRWLEGDEEALDLLVRYNRADVEGLPALLRIATERARARVASALGEGA